MMNNSYSINRLILTNYRSYEKLRIDANDIKNIIITGDNGAGKTNILEAISMLSMSGPFRKAKLHQLGKIGSPDSTFTISSEIKTNEDILHLGLSYNYNNAVKSVYYDDDNDTENEISERRQIIVDNMNIQVSELQNFIRVVWITPFMDRLFSEATSERRKFLDNLICNFYPFYGVSLTQYSNLLKQRSKILKKQTYDEKWLDAIENEIAEKGVSIAALRIEFEEKLNKILGENKTNFPTIQIKIEGSIEDKLKESKSVDVEEYFRQILKKNRELFKYSFSPAVEGIHRSDFSAINMDKGISADQTSTGEQKCTVISIILAYCNMLYLYFNKYPIILIDEAPAHLDDIRVKDLFTELEKIPTQIWLTGILKSDFDFFNDKNSLFIEIEHSSIK